jgi:hypothetical protein
MERSYEMSLSLEIRLDYIKNNWELNHLGTRLCFKSVETIPSDFHVLQLTKVLQTFRLYNIE